MTLSVACNDSDHHLCRPDRELCECPCHVVEPSTFDAFLSACVSDCVEGR